ncbi:MAG: hypothetical protein HOD63_08590 [Bacteroidetes bacterium]|jgi:hypothetical protein|nr:hypothetical protein [Bacteroidota bacterium]MBT5529975.1 hypothetical protein [Cytophagia bacterium]MBT3423412.1 hypothetical protein [Bacteroidota bacterium]MBT3801768.1 hypothetical protein [Bacteroidota bacterium]MBT3932923.1 hypothetical protein [Bacteroidota bacterium]
MKKLFAMLIIMSMIFFAACNSEQTESTNAQEAEDIEQAVEEAMRGEIEEEVAEEVVVEDEVNEVPSEDVSSE